MRPITLPALRAGYREAAIAGANRQEIVRLLQTASDALTLAVLTLEGRSGDDRGDKLRRAEHARGFMVEAVTALGRARVYVPKLKTHALPVLLATERRPEAELARLHQMATRLLWQNHAYLPARSEATPLAPEDERQLAVVVAGVSRGARIDRALRYRWCGVALGVAGMGMLCGFT
ncbi:MAG: hypothetical protein IAG13_38555, partial [Deltaproteobacteria bacterium]|nr:hypothetical protein [Nannocystaceae bacterium]